MNDYDFYAERAGEFLSDRVVFGPGLSTRLDTLYSSYKRWCARISAKPACRTWFGRYVRAHAMVHYPMQMRAIQRVGKTIYVGLGVN